MWHKRGDVLQVGDGEGWHGTSPGADQDEEGERGGIINNDNNNNNILERIKMRKGREVERTA